ncbi:MAG: urea ABC transporter permease subunit UrtB, partial [Acidovorax sp.]|nr:urea ABC transporter permease subunit UrtB [Acidovorax sp.]
MKLARTKALFGGLLLGLAGGAFALTPDQALRIASGDSEARIAALDEVVAAADPALEAYLQALLANQVQLAGGRAFVVQGERAVDAASGAAAVLPSGAEDVINNNRMRRELQAAMAALRLFSPERQQRAQAINALKAIADEDRLALIQKAERAETDTALKQELALLKAAVLVTSNDPLKRL